MFNNINTNVNPIEIGKNKKLHIILFTLIRY